MATQISGATGASRVQDGIITTAKIDNNAVIATKIADGVIINEKIANNAIRAQNLDSVGQGAGNPPVYGCRAWVNFQGRTTNGICTLVGSGNVASISRTATGRYTLTFTTAMPDANYAVIGNGHWNITTADRQHTITVVYPVLSTGFSFTISDGTGNTYQDPTNNSIAIFR